MSGYKGTAENLLEDVDDATLIKQVAGGDTDSFQALAKRYTAMLYSVAYRMFPQKSDAEDIVQEALLKLWSKAHLWREDAGASVSTWLYRLAYNLCIDHKRKDRMISGVLDENQIDGGDLPDKDVKDAQMSDIVGAAVSDLPERQRSALVLCHFEGLSNAEAAEIMGTTVKAIEGLLVRARKTLADSLQDYKGVL